MPELLLELFSEEIPARMQDSAATALARLLTEALAPLSPTTITTYYGPRRIALACNLAATVPASTTVERGPRASAPPQALEGFLRKHGATRDQLADENGHWVLTKSSPAIPAATLIATTIPALLRRFPWPKSMRWGGDMPGGGQPIHLDPPPSPHPLRPRRQYRPVQPRRRSR